MADIVRIGGGGVAPPAEQPDAHGQAALMLAESMLHALVDAGTFSTEDAVAIIGVAQEVKELMGEAARETPGNIVESIHLLDQIASSFGTDIQ